MLVPVESDGGPQKYRTASWDEDLAFQDPHETGRIKLPPRPETPPVQPNTPITQVGNVTVR